MSLYAYVIVDGTQVQFTVWQTGTDHARLDFYRQDRSGAWHTEYGHEDCLHGGTPEGFLEEQVSAFMSLWVDNGCKVRRLP